MRWVRIAGAVCMALALSAHTAGADRFPTHSERAAVERVFSVPPGCGRIRVSTISRRFATFRGTYDSSARCRFYDSDGWALLHRGDHGWKTIFDGSDFVCPIKGAPKTVLVDLQFCPAWSITDFDAASSAFAEAQKLAADAWTPPPIPRIHACSHDDRWGVTWYCEIYFQSQDFYASCTGGTFVVTSDARGEPTVEDPDPKPTCGS